MYVVLSPYICAHTHTHIHTNTHIDRRASVKPALLVCVLRLSIKSTGNLLYRAKEIK